MSTTESPSEPVPEMTALEVVSADAGDDADAVEAAAERAKLGRAVSVGLGEAQLYSPPPSPSPSEGWVAVCP